MENLSAETSVPVKRTRIWEIDAWRGAIIVYMVTFHLLYDLHYFYGLTAGPSLILGPFTPGLIVSLTFYPLAGISSGLSRHPVRNGLRTLAAALTLSLTTYVLMPSQFIGFGTLHLLATAMLLTPVWNRIPTKMLPVVAAICLVMGQVASAHVTTLPWLFPFGLRTLEYAAMDYFPLFPYLAPYLVGVWIFRCIYTPRNLTSLLPEWKWTRPLQHMGKHSLLIYMLHQPLIWGVLAVVLGMPKL